MRKKKLTIITIVLAIIAVISISFCVWLVVNDTKGGKAASNSEIDVVLGIEESIFDDETEFEEDVVDNAPGAEVENSAGSSSGQSASSGSTGTSQGSSGNSNNAGSGSSSSGSSSSGSSSSGEMDYESFHAMSPAKQQEYMESYDDIEKFFDWYNAAKETYEKENPSIEVDGGSIDLDKLINGN